MSRTSYPIVERLADQVIVTARSTVEAQQAAGEAMGGDCTIISVERVHEGGIGGFFATELVRVTARPSRFHRADRELDAAMTSAEELVSSLRVASPMFADRLMSELRQPRDTPYDDETAEVHASKAPETEERSFAAQLMDDEPFEDEQFEDELVDATVPLMRPIEIAAPIEAPRSVAQDVVAHTAVAQTEVPRVMVPQVTVPQIVIPQVAAQALHRCSPVADPQRAPAIVPRRASAAIDPRWSHQTLRALGLPDRLVDIAMLQRPVEGPQWIMALMGAFRTLCSPPPAGPTVVVGPSCANLARQLRLVSVGADELSESLSSVAIPNVSTSVARSALNDRFVHVMVGGPWQHLASIRPHVVSAATESDLLEAVRVCCAWDATLGWTLVDDRYERIDEFTLVAHVRSIVYGISS